MINLTCCTIGFAVVHPTVAHSTFAKRGLILAMEYIVYAPPIISFSGYLLAIRHVRAGTFHPEPVSRGIFVFVTLLGLLLLLQSDPNQASALLAFGLFGGSVFLFLLSVRAEKIKVSKQDVIAILGAIICLLIWFMSGSPFLALIAILLTDAFAVIPTVFKTWINPFFEDIWFWLVLSTGSILSLGVLLAQSPFNSSSFLYVGYFTASQLFMCGLIILRRYELLPRKSKVRQK